MTKRLDCTHSDFEADFSAFLLTKREASEEVDTAVRAIIADVRADGDAALARFSARFDGTDLDATGLAVSTDEIDAAVETVEPATMDALRLAHARIERHHARQLPEDDIYEDDLGVRLGGRWTPIAAVGLYVPGGTASYPSSVLMNAIPARVAGVERIVMAVPGRKGAIDPVVLAAARLAGVDDIYRVGGAQAIAALAYGTQTIKPVDKIVGPGNAYVAAAKRQVFGTVGIDMIAGPSEVLILADAGNDPEWIAADLLAQCEHDAGAQAILVTDDAAFADAVCDAVEKALHTLKRTSTAAASWRDFGAVILVPGFDAAITLADRIAAEHLQVALAEPEAIVARIRNAGAIFIGRHTPEVIGDYVGGSNHVLPTARSARFSSGLSVLDYMKRTSILHLEADQLRTLGPAAIALAEAEGLDAHARAVAVRLNL